jgi:basic membrane protein A and related proteins
MRKQLKALTLGCMAAVALAASPVKAADPFKVGFVYVGPVGDHGWTYRHDEGRKAVVAKFGDKVKTTFVENVSEGPDAERVIRQLAANGHQLIFTTSFGFMNPTLKVAKKFPKVKFEHATGYKRTPNISTYSGRFYEGRHVAGLIAGHTTKTNVVGYIASFPIPEVVRGINAFTLAMRSVNPKAEVKVVWVNTWYDPGKEGDAAKALLDQGADVISQHTDSPAPLQVAEKRGAFAVGQASDMKRFAPKAQLMAIVDDWGPYYISRVTAAMDGSWKSTDTWDGIGLGMVVVASINDSLPADVQALAKKAAADLASGKIHAFDGPVKDQSGKVVIPAGQHAPDGMLLGMDWYVEGVQGKLPK